MINSDLLQREMKVRKDMHLSGSKELKGREIIYSKEGKLYCTMYINMLKLSGFLI